MCACARDRRPATRVEHCGDFPACELCAPLPPAVCERVSLRGALRARAVLRMRGTRQSISSWLFMQQSRTNERQRSDSGECAWFTLRMFSVWIPARACLCGVWMLRHSNYSWLYLRMCFIHLYSTNPLWRKIIIQKMKVIVRTEMSSCRSCTGFVVQFCCSSPGHSLTAS